MTGFNGFTSLRRVLATGTIVLAAGFALFPRSAEAQAGVTSYHACYVPGSGTIYRIKEANTPGACRKSTHVEFQWIDFPRAIAPTLVHTNQTINPGTAGFALVAQCPLGSIAAAGGYYLEGTTLTLVGNAPSTDVRQWIVTVRNEGSVAYKAHAYARCVRE
jgi:hypothetical protein